MQNDQVWELPFGDTAELELQSEWGSLTLLPLEPGQRPRLELSRGSAGNVAVHVERVGEAVRVALDPHRNWFGSWECRAKVYVPSSVRASVETSAGSVSARGLEGCDLRIKASAGKIELDDVYGFIHLAADAGSITGRGLGGFFDVEAHAGSIRLEIRDLQPGDHRIQASMGSVRLELARGIDVCIETHTSLGSVRNNFPMRQDAPSRLVLTTEMGSIRVEEALAARPPHGPEAPPRPKPPESQRATREDPELERILKMVEAGELTAQDADELLQAMGRV
jgi:hypothetical protein